jgi:ATP-dependent Zn protease
VAKARSGGSNSGLALDRESVLTQLLAEMDGFSSKIGIVVMATTNRAVSTLSTGFLPYTVYCIHYCYC